MVIALLKPSFVTTMYYLLNAQWDVSHKNKYYIISVRFVKSGCMFLSLEAGNWKLDVHVQQYWYG